MTKDEMKDKISMAFKDPVSQQNGRKNSKIYVDCIKEFSFTESQVKQMGCDHYLRSKKEKDVAEKTKEENLEKLKKEHPLVTDERCFTLSWFPEIIPSILSEVEE